MVKYENTKTEYKHYKGKTWMIVTDEDNFVRECKEIVYDRIEEGEKSTSGEEIK